MDLPFVSIVMPVYNGGHYFALALESAVKQNYPNFEIIVVDDGSSDGGEAKRISAAAGEKVRYIYQENRGVAGALNTGVSAMRGDIFCWLSHDDLFLPNKTIEQAAYFKKLNVDNAIIFSDYNLIGPKGEYIKTIKANRQSLISTPMAALLSGSINGCTIFAPARAVRSVGGFDEKLRYTQDYDFWNRLLVHCEFFHQQDVTVDYRIHPDQGSNNPKAVIEGDALWINMIRQRSEVERVQMHGSSRRFFAHMHKHLVGSPYTRAAQYALYRCNAAESASKISAVVHFANGTSDDALIRTVDSLQNQTRVPEEIFVVTDNLEVERLPGICLIFEGSSKLKMIDAALRKSSGDYLLAMEAGTTLETHAVLSRVQSMQELGGIIGWIGEGRPDEAVLRGNPPDLSQLIFHRSILGYGPMFSDVADDFGTGWGLAGLLRCHSSTLLSGAV